MASEHAFLMPGNLVPTSLSLAVAKYGAYLEEEEKSERMIPFSV
jgi:hypothetical protein